MLFCYDGRMLICPHCERELGVEHDAAGCRRKMSRRFFFGMLGAAFGAAVAAPAIEPMLQLVDVVPVDPVLTKHQRMILEAFRAQFYARNIDSVLFVRTDTLVSGLHTAQADTRARRPHSSKERGQQR